MANPFLIAEDNALKTYCQGVVVGDDINQSRAVQVWFGYPDVEVRAQAFPFITIDLIDIVPADNRQTSGVMYDNDMNATLTPITNQYYLHEVPIAYDLVYQLTSYARHPRHDRAIISQMLQKFPSKYGKLPVLNQNGAVTVNRSMFLDGFVKRDAVEGETGNRRLLRNVFTVRIISELLPNQAATIIKSVSTVVLDNISPTPNGYNMVY